MRSTHRPFFEDVKSDKTGPMMPADRQLFGEDAIISLDLKDFVWSVWELIASRSRGIAQAAGGAGVVLAGSYPAGSIGALMSREGLMFRICVYRPYALKTLFVANGMRVAYNYLQGYLLGPDDIDQSMRAMKHRTIFHAIPLDLTMATAGSTSASPGNSTAGKLGGGFTLYDSTYTGLPAATA